MESSIYFQLDFNDNTYYLSFESVTTDVNYFPYLSSVPELSWGGDGYLKVFTGSIRIFREATVANKSLQVDVAPYHPFAGSRLNDLINYKEKIPFRIYTDLTQDPVIAGNLVLSEITDEEVVLMVIEEDYESRSVRPVLEKSSAMFVDNFKIFEETSTGLRYLIVEVGSNTMFNTQELIFERIAKSETEAGVSDIFQNLVFQSEPKEEDERRYLISDRSTNDFMIRKKETNDYVLIDDIIDSSDLQDVINTATQADSQVFEGKEGVIYLIDNKYDPINQYICGGYSINPVAFGKVQIVDPVVPYGDRHIRKDYLEYENDQLNPPQEVNGNWSEMVNDRIVDSIPYKSTIPAFEGVKNEGSTITYTNVGELSESFVIAGGKGNYTNSSTTTWSNVHWIDEFAYKQSENSSLFSLIGSQGYIYGVNTQTPIINTGDVYYRVTASGGPFKYLKSIRNIYSGDVTEHDSSLSSHYTKLSSPSYASTGVFTDNRSGTSSMTFRTFTNGTTTLYAPQANDTGHLGSDQSPLKKGFFYERVPNTGDAGTYTEDGMYWKSVLSFREENPIISTIPNNVRGVVYRSQSGSTSRTIYGNGSSTDELQREYFQITDSVISNSSGSFTGEVSLYWAEAYGRGRGGRTFKTGKTTGDTTFYEWIDGGWGEKLVMKDLFDAMRNQIRLKFKIGSTSYFLKWMRDSDIGDEQLGTSGQNNFGYILTSYLDTATHTVFNSSDKKVASYEGNKDLTSFVDGDWTYQCPSGSGGTSYWDQLPFDTLIRRPTGTASKYAANDYKYSLYRHVSTSGYSTGDEYGEESSQSLIDRINQNGIDITYNNGSGIGNGFNVPNYRIKVNGTSDSWELSKTSVPNTYHNTKSNIILTFEKIERVPLTGWLIEPRDEEVGHAKTPEYRTDSARKYVYRENKTPTYHDTIYDKAEGFNWRESSKFDSTEPYYLAHVDTFSDSVQVGSLKKRITFSNSLLPNSVDKNLPVFINITSVIDHSDHTDKIYGLFRNTVQNDNQFLDLLDTDSPPNFSFSTTLNNTSKRDWKLSITGLNLYNTSVADNIRPEYKIKYHVYAGAECVKISETKGSITTDYTPDFKKDGYHYTDHSTSSRISSIDLHLSKTKEFDDDITNSLVGIDVWVYRRVTPKANVVSSQENVYACCGCYYKLEASSISYDQSGSCTYIDCHQLSQSFISSSADRAVYSIRNPSLRVGKEYGLVVYDEGARLDDESELLYTSSDDNFINLTHVPFGQLAITGWSIYGTTIYDFFKNFIIPKLQVEDSTIQDEPDITYAVDSETFNLNFYQSDEISILELAKEICSKSNYIFYFNTLKDSKQLVLVDLNQSLSTESEEIVTTRPLTWSGKGLEFHANFLTTKKWNNFVTNLYHNDFKPPSSWIDDNRQVLILNPIDVHTKWQELITNGQTWESTMSTHNKSDVLSLYPEADEDLEIWQREYYKEFKEGDKAWIAEIGGDYSEIIDEWVFPMKSVPRAFSGFESIGDGRSYIYYRSDLTSNTYSIHSDSLSNKCMVPCTIRKYFFNHSLINKTSGETYHLTYDTICLVLDPHYLIACPTNATENTNQNHIVDWNDDQNKLFMPNTDYFGTSLYKSPFTTVYMKTKTAAVEEKELEYGKIESISIDFKFPIKNLIGQIEVNTIYSAVKTEELVSVSSRFISNQTMMKKSSVVFKEKMSGIGNDEQVDLLAQNAEEGKILLKRHAKTKSMPDVVVTISYIDFDIKIGDRLKFNDENRRLTISMIVTGMSYNVDEEKTSFRGIANITSIIEES